MSTNTKMIEMLDTINVIDNNNLNQNLDVIEDADNEGWRNKWDNVAISEENEEQMKFNQKYDATKAEMEEFRNNEDTQLWGIGRNEFAIDVMRWIFRFMEEDRNDKSVNQLNVHFCNYLLKHTGLAGRGYPDKWISEDLMKKKIKNGELSKGEIRNYERFLKEMEKGRSKLRSAILNSIDSMKRDNAWIKEMWKEREKNWELFYDESDVELYK